MIYITFILVTRIILYSVSALFPLGCLQPGPDSRFALITDVRTSLRRESHWRGVCRPYLQPRAKQPVSL